MVDYLHIIHVIFQPLIHMYQVVVFLIYLMYLYQVVFYYECMHAFDPQQPTTSGLSDSLGSLGSLLSVNY